MAEPLELPRSIAELYLARVHEVSSMRPIMTGDVFSDIEIPGVEQVDGDERKLAMVVTHPCSMRKGVKMKVKQQMIRVVRSKPVELPAWRSQYFDRLPLPALLQPLDTDEPADEDNGTNDYAALFEFRGRVSTAELLLSRRIACLSEEGVAFLHQRISHVDTRYPARISDLMSACSGVFAEAELAQEWNERLIRVDVDDHVALAAALDHEALEFESIIGAQRSYVQGKKTVKSAMREDLADDRKKAHARRELLRLVREREK